MPILIKVCDTDLVLRLVTLSSETLLVKFVMLWDRVSCSLLDLSFANITGSSCSKRR